MLKVVEEVASTFRPFFTSMHHMSWCDSTWERSVILADNRLHHRLHGFDVSLIEGLDVSALARGLSSDQKTRAELDELRTDAKACEEALARWDRNVQ